MAKTPLPLVAEMHSLLGRGLDWVWPAGAARAYGDALREVPRSAELHFLRGRALERSGLWREAVSEFSSASEIEPANLEYQGALVIALHQAGRETALIEALQRLAQLRPGQGEIHVLIGALLRRSGRKAEALRAFRLGVRLAPGPSARRFVLGEILLGHEPWLQAVDAWQDARQLEGARTAPSPARLGHSALNVHPGRQLDPRPVRPRRQRRLRLDVTAGIARLASAISRSSRQLLGRGAQRLTLEQRVRSLRRAWQKVQPRGWRAARRRAA